MSGALLVLASAMAVWPSDARCAGDPEALRLVRDSDRRHRVKEEITEAELILQENGGAQKRQQGRFARSQTTKSSDLGDKLWFRFSAPASVSGLTLLSIDGQADTRQWLYLPAFKKSKRVPSTELADRFGDTDFFYQDLRQWRVEDYAYQILGTEAVGGAPCYVLSAKPSSGRTLEESPYGQSKMWLRKSDLFVMKLQHFDRQNRPWKEIRFEEPTSVEGEAHRANRTVVLDIQRKHQTTLVVRKRTVNDGVPPAWFDSQAFFE